MDVQRINPDLHQTLVDIVGAEHVLTDEEDREFYSQDIYRTADDIAAVVVRPGSSARGGPSHRSGHRRRILGARQGWRFVLHRRVAAGPSELGGHRHQTSRPRGRDQHRRHVRGGGGGLHLAGAPPGAQTPRGSAALLGSGIRRHGHGGRQPVPERHSSRFSPLRRVGGECARARGGARRRHRRAHGIGIDQRRQALLPSLRPGPDGPVSRRHRSPGHQDSSRSSADAHSAVGSVRLVRVCRRHAVRRGHGRGGPVPAGHHVLRHGPRAPAPEDETNQPDPGCQGAQGGRDLGQEHRQGAQGGGQGGRGRALVPGGAQLLHALHRRGSQRDRCRGEARGAAEASAWAMGTRWRTPSPRSCTATPSSP